MIFYLLEFILFLSQVFPPRSGDLRGKAISQTIGFKADGTFGRKPTMHIAFFLGLLSSKESQTKASLTDLSIALKTFFEITSEMVIRTFLGGQETFEERLYRKPSASKLIEHSAENQQCT